jgi:hypothetical protein
MTIEQEKCRIYDRVCKFCYPSHDDELHEKCKHLLTKNGHWIGGWTKEKGQEASRIQQEFEKDRRAKCIDLDVDYGCYVCKKHLLELAEFM